MFTLVLTDSVGVIPPFNGAAEDGDLFPGLFAKRRRYQIPGRVLQTVAITAICQMLSLRCRRLGIRACAWLISLLEGFDMRQRPLSSGRACTTTAKQRTKHDGRKKVAILLVNSGTKRSSKRRMLELKSLFARQPMAPQRAPCWGTLLAKLAHSSLFPGVR